MWDPKEKCHFCDRCDEVISYMNEDFRTSIFTTGATKIPKEVMPDFMTAFGFKAPLFCYKCALPIVTMVMDHCKEWRRERDAAKAKEEKERQEAIRPQGDGGNRSGPT